MMLVAPALLVRRLQDDEHPIFLDALNQALLSAPFSSRLDKSMFVEQWLQPHPRTLYPVRWQSHQCLCAWRAKRLEGWIDVAVGFDSDNLDLPDYRPIGLLRFLWLVNPLADDADVTAALFNAAEQYWRSAGVAQIKAFHRSIGCLAFQAGLGALPGDWSSVFRALTGAGYQLSERYYSLCRLLQQPIEEVTPLADLSLVYSGEPSDRTYQVYHRTDWVGIARVVTFHLAGDSDPLRLAKLVHIEVEPLWRGMNIGKWLVKRIINDYTLQGYQYLLAHPPHSRHIAIALLNQLGFEEQNYRGYSLEKTLIS
jgi:GNAT superfamily N-acetyltransferase